MCDYSLHNVKSRPAKVGDKLTTRDFGTGTHGFSASEDASVVVCVRPRTELSFAEEVTFSATGLLGWWRKVINHKRRQSFDKSTRKGSSAITMRWNFRTAGSCS
jgi:hypothetical protein